jgi:hypothetical protein
MHGVMPGVDPACLPGDLDRVGLGVLTTLVPAVLVDEALAASGGFQRRVRRLPARVVVYFVLALTLFGSQAYREVWRQLTGRLSGLGPAVSRSALSQARRRLGVAPLREVFDRVRGVQGSAGSAGVFFAGLRVLAWDGTQFLVADSAANAACFPRTRGGKGNVAGFPHVLAMVLIECGTHAVVDARIGGRSEQQMAGELVGSLDAGVLLLADRNFLSYPLWNKARAGGAQLLWRAKVSCRPFAVPGALLADGSYLAILPEPVAMARRRGQQQLKRFAGHDFGPPAGTLVRVVEYTITVATTGDDGSLDERCELVVLVTSLLDPAAASARQLAELYHERWESENGYREIKIAQRGAGSVLRSQDPAGVEQELWAYLITYQSMRIFLLHVADRAGRDCDELSFTAVLRVVRRKITAGPRGLAQAWRQAAAEILTEINGPRRARTSPRTVKRPGTSFPRPNHPPGQKASQPATYTVQINQDRLPVRA